MWDRSILRKAVEGYGRLVNSTSRKLLYTILCHGSEISFAVKISTVNRRQVLTCLNNPCLARTCLSITPICSHDTVMFNGHWRERRLVTDDRGNETPGGTRGGTSRSLPTEGTTLVSYLLDTN